ncbi:MAG: winged helix-turn-helix domain-containing protein [Pyrinomonadaceae bacterium]|nr:winged helix-turn-helix domain-containing protein [Pyrinomonadaceae bacterium]
MSSEINNLYEFDKFRFDGETHCLWRGEQLITLSPKASELLKLLLEYKGEFVSKREIFDSVWAETFVEDGVLTQNIYTLRKALGSGADGLPLIENKTRLGYRITAPVRVLSASNGNSRFPGTKNDEKLSPAVRTQTELSSQPITVEDSPQPLPAKPFGKRKKLAEICVVIFVLLSVGGFFGYQFWNREIIVKLSPIENVQFKKLTDTGEISFPTVSRDGDFAAFVKGGQLMLKDVKSNKDVALDVPNHKIFGSLQFSNDGAFLFFRNQKELHLASGIYQISRFGGAAKLVAEDVWTQFGLSPDNRRVAFVRYFADQNRYVLIVKNLDSGKERELISRNYPEFPAFNAAPAWSPDGTRIALTVQDRAKLLSQLMLIDAENGAEKAVQTDGFRQIEEIVWLPDGENVIVSANRTGKFMQLWKIETATGFSRRITNDLASYQNLSLTADGKTLVANQFTQYSNLWTATDGKPENLKQITFGNSMLDGLSAIDWFEDEKILYVSHEIQKPFQEIWTVNPFDNARLQLTNNTDYQAEFPTAAADQRYVFFNSNQTGLLQIWRTEKDGGNLTQITRDESGHNGLPVVSPDGKWLYYLNKKEAVSTVRRKSLDDGADTIFFARADLSPSAWIAVSPDGKRLGFINYADKSPTEGSNRTYQIVVVATDNPNDARFYKISASARYFEFSPDNTSLEYIENTAAEGKIRRQSLADESKGEAIFTIPKDTLFHFARSKDGKHLAIARGQQINDAVLLTGFE